ncbi:MAG: GIY-YIG nuclease family protein, partial [SAR324 cluster bacterium]|nr:GIY-YIG nuclease family protein [SAR324 cluster bacterium]
MKYVYILRSLNNAGKSYIGITGDLRKRLRQHNSRLSIYTKQFAPWKLESYVAFSNAEKAMDFERYLKKSGGWRFAKRRL